MIGLPNGALLHGSGDAITAKLEAYMERLGQEQAEEAEAE
jgi:hypothetical protein